MRLWSNRKENFELQGYVKKNHIVWLLEVNSETVWKPQMKLRARKIRFSDSTARDWKAVTVEKGQQCSNNLLALPNPKSVSLREMKEKKMKQNHGSKKFTGWTHTDLNAAKEREHQRAMPHATRVTVCWSWGVGSSHLTPFFRRVGSEQLSGPSNVFVSWWQSWD